MFVNPTPIFGAAARRVKRWLTDVGIHRVGVVFAVGLLVGVVVVIALVDGHFEAEIAPHGATVRLDSECEDME